MTTDNPFFAASDLPYQLPPFDRIEIGHYLPAFERGMAEQRAEVEAIATLPEPPTFDNVLVALERSGRVLQRVSAAFFNVTSSDTSPDLQQIESQVVPLLSAHGDAIMLDRRLFARIEQLYASRDALALDGEAAWLLERYHTEFVRAGARLTEQEHVRLRELNAELAALATEFGNSVRDEMKASAVVVQDAEDLAGLSADAVAAAEVAARDRGLADGYALNLILPTAQPALASLHNRAVRERLHTASVRRGSSGGEHDTTASVLRIVRLRAERARLLGFEHHAAYNIADNTARSVDAVQEMLAKLAPAAVANARIEAEDLQETIGDAFTLEPWDWAYYTEQIRRERYAIDEAELRPYFELERVLRDGVFFAAGRLYGIRFEERPDLPAYHADARVFEVFDRDGGPSACSSATSSPVRRSAAAPGPTPWSRSRGCSAPHRSSSTTSTSTGPRRASRRCSRWTRSGPCSTSSVTRCTPSSRRCTSRSSPAPGSPAISSSIRPRSTRCGCCGRRSWPTTPRTTAPASRCRSRWWSGCRRPSSSTRASRPRSTWPRRCWTWPGTR